jgi:hypothetical protein
VPVHSRRRALQRDRSQCEWHFEGPTRSRVPRRPAHQGKPRRPPAKYRVEKTAHWQRLDCPTHRTRDPGAEGTDHVPGLHKSLGGRLQIRIGRHGLLNERIQGRIVIQCPPIRAQVAVRWVGLDEWARSMPGGRDNILRRLIRRREIQRRKQIAACSQAEKGQKPAPRPDDTFHMREPVHRDVDRADCFVCACCCD